MPSNLPMANAFWVGSQWSHIWLQQEPKKSQSVFIRPFIHLVQTCLKLSIFIFWVQILHDDFRMTQSTQRALSKKSDSTQTALREHLSNYTLSYCWSLKYFVSFIPFLKCHIKCKTKLGTRLCLKCYSGRFSAVINNLYFLTFLLFS